MTSKRTPKAPSLEELEVLGKTPEVFFGLIGPVGTDLAVTINALSKELSNLNYCVELIKLSDILPYLKGLGVDLKKSPFDEKVHSYMSAGTKYKTKMEKPEALALAGITLVREVRRRITGDSEKPGKIAYIFDSLKNVEEVALLRKIYGDLFSLISVYAPRDKRKETLAKKIAKSCGKSSPSRYYDKAETLIERDYDEQAGAAGQNVGGAFHLADLFVDESDKKSLQHNIKRFVEILFGHPFHTPTQEEYGQFIASIAALRSADLSRQVGAVIMDDDGCVISLGCNEVPKAGGGLYWPGDSDARDFKIGYDSSAKAKNEMLTEIITNLYNEKLFDPKKVKDSEHLIQALTEGNQKAILKDSTVSNILEFGRIVHAEMAAITDSAKRGLATGGKTLFCTTFPCHICARHIIAAGIKQVYFVEPYPKSKAKDLYDDSVCIDAPAEQPNKVSFKSFMGIAPNKANVLFKMSNKRKGPVGDAVEWTPQSAKYRFTIYLPLYLKMEQGHLLEWKEQMDKKRLKIVQE